MISSSLYSMYLFNGDNTGFLEGLCESWGNFPEKITTDWQRLFVAPCTPTSSQTALLWAIVGPQASELINEVVPGD